MPKNIPHLALLSGLLCDGSVWDGVIDALGDAAKPVAISFAGCTTIRQMAEKVLASMPGTFALAGHSMGGRVALEVYRMAPQQIERLALLNTGVRPRTEKEVPGRQRLLDLADVEGMASVARSWLPPMMSEAARGDSGLMAQLNTMIERHSPAEFHGQIHALLDRPDAEQVLATVTVPTLLLSGDQDQWSPVAQHQAMQQILPHATLVALAGVGHMSTVEAPVQIANALEQWLTG
ncbi:alpha/beta fold hydrolase [Halioxenophilus aromaticivorans]|uniref:Alpha/beta hydrolase n=1 Tax=Halioxenophilus aromaticivorans TaxID=1306992 RepID=A0AAV3U2L5_9ALTE